MIIPLFFYTQLRSLGVRLIFPNNIKSTINNKYYIKILYQLILIFKTGSKYRT